MLIIIVMWNWNSELIRSLYIIDYVGNWISKEIADIESQVCSVKFKSVEG